MKVGWVDWDGDEIIQQVEQYAREVVYQGAEHLRGEANKTVPLEEGILKGSSRTTMADGGRALAIVSYDTPYACRQHEETGWRHNAGRRAKWLELTWKEQAGRVAEWMAERMKGAFG